MRGKQPKERDHYVLRIADGTLVDVTREVYLEWYQSRRREKYQKERNREHGICSLNELEGKEKYSGFLDVEEGLEEMVCGTNFGMQPQDDTKPPETNIKRIMPENEGTGDSRGIFLISV